MQLPKVEIRVKLDDGWLKFACLVVPDIGVKAAIELHQFDRDSGPIGLLVGLAQQAYQTNRVARFESKQYPQVGIYMSPLLSRGLSCLWGLFQNHWLFMVIQQTHLG